MNALVIGCGYLGKRVAALWKARGDTVHVTTRRPEAAAEFRELGYRPIICDVTRPETMALPKVDVVAYAVALDRSTNVSMGEVYVLGLGHVLAHLPPGGRFVYVSSSSVYGQTDGSWVDEDSPAEPQEPSGQVVLEAERLLRAWRPTAIVLRFSGIYGPDRWLRRQAIEAGETIVGDDGKWLNLIHVDDGATVVVAAGDRGAEGQTYNICDDEPVRRRDFYREMAAVLKAPEPKFAPPPADAPLPPHEFANRRVRNRRMHEELGVLLAYPNYRLGLQASVG